MFRRRGKRGWCQPISNSARGKFTFSRLFSVTARFQVATIYRRPPRYKQIRLFGRTVERAATVERPRLHNMTTQLILTPARGPCYAFPFASHSLVQETPVVFSICGSAANGFGIGIEKERVMKRVIIGVVGFAVLAIMGGAVLVVQAQIRGGATLPASGISNEPVQLAPGSGFRSSGASSQAVPSLTRTPAQSYQAQAGPYSNSKPVPAANPYGPAPSSPEQAKFTQLTHRLAQLLDEQGLQEEIARTQTRIAELEAKQAVQEASKILNNVLSNYPKTEAAGNARKMLGIQETTPAVDKASYEDSGQATKDNRANSPGYSAEESTSGAATPLFDPPSTTDQEGAAEQGAATIR